MMKKGNLQRFTKKIIKWIWEYIEIMDLSLSLPLSLYMYILKYIEIQIHVVLVQSLSHVWLFANTWNAARQPSLSFTSIQSLLKLIPIESVMPSNHLIFCCPLLLLPSILPSVKVDSESALCIRWPKYWSFSFNISPSSE